MYFDEEYELERIIKIQTGTITNITTISCTVQGTILDIGDRGIYQHGHCWSTTWNPTTNNEITNLGSRNSVGTFSSNLTGLSPNTKCSVRAYAVDNAFTAYGNQKNFTTDSVVIPTVTTSAVTTITNNSASSGGNVITTGGGTITARGVCWSTSQNPTELNSNTVDGSGTGSFTSSITGLSGGTIYYV
ncbi:MAG: hypothetical protein ISS19_05295 [Bacteroidales bacterium]|nr:hypothetical protein [Bacteroidales bacterium]